MLPSEIVLAAALPDIKINDRIIVNFGTKEKPEYWTSVVTERSTYRGKPSIKVLFDDGDVAMYYAMVNASGIIGRAALLTARAKPIPTTQLKKWVVAEDLELLNTDNGRSTQVKRYVEKLVEDLELPKVKASPNGKDVYILSGEEDKSFGYLRDAFTTLTKDLEFHEVAKGTMDSPRGVIHQFYFSDKEDKHYAVYRSYEDNTFAIYVGLKSAFRKEFTLLKGKSAFKATDYSSLDKIKKALTSLTKGKLDKLKDMANDDVQKITSPAGSGIINDQTPLVIKVTKPKAQYLVTMVHKAGTTSLDRIRGFALETLTRAVNGEVEFKNIMTTEQDTGVAVCPKVIITQWCVKGTNAVKPDQKSAIDAAETTEKILEVRQNRG